MLWQETPPWRNQGRRAAIMGLRAGGVRRGRNASSMVPEGAAMWLFPLGVFRSEFRLESVSCSEGTALCLVR
jgi:hypothetical protein